MPRRRKAVRRVRLRVSRAEKVISGLATRDCRVVQSRPNKRDIVRQLELNRRVKTGGHTRGRRPNSYGRYTFSRIKLYGRRTREPGPNEIMRLGSFIRRNIHIQDPACKHNESFAIIIQIVKI